MYFFPALTIIISMAIFFGSIVAVTRAVLKHRRDMARIKHGGDIQAAPDVEKIELKETVAMLQDRLAVLESIATDPARRTAEEIEKLR